MRRLVVVLAALVVAALVSPGPAGAGPAPVEPGPWQVLSKLNRGHQAQVSCASTDWCWAVGGGDLLFSADVGASWTVRTAQVPAEVDELTALDCPTATVCYLTAVLEDGTNAVLVAGPHGAMSISPAPGDSGFGSISCATDRRCVALATDEETVARTADGGATWASVSPQRPDGLDEVSCVAGTTTCTAVGSTFFAPIAARSTNSGRSWTLQTLPSGIDDLNAVDCATELVCRAGGDSPFDPVMVGTDDGGTTWTVQPLPAAAIGAIDSISCPGELICYAFGSDFGTPQVFRTDNGGTPWHLQSLPLSQGRVVAVSCPTTTRCAAVGREATGFTTANSGLAWTTVPVPGELGTIDHLACPMTGWCVGSAREDVVRPVVVTSSDGGRTWARHAFPGGTGFLSGLVCPTRFDCHAWAFTSGSTARLFGQALRSVDGGLTWRLRRGGEVRALGRGQLGCVDADRCLAAGAGRHEWLVRTTVDGGESWQVVAPPAGLTAVTAVGCSVAGCVITGRTGSVQAPVPTTWSTTDLGATWTPRSLPPGELIDVDCEQTRCVAVGRDPGLQGRAYWSADLGLTWRAAALPAGTAAVREVDCAPGVCVLAGNNGSQSGDGGEYLVGGGQGRSFVVADAPPMGASWAQSVGCAPRRQLCLGSDSSSTGVPRVVGPGKSP